MTIPQNLRFMQLLVNTALDAVETREEGKIDRDKVKFLKMPYKGIYHPTVIRETVSHNKVSKGLFQVEVQRGLNDFCLQKKTSVSDDDLPFGVVYPPLADER